MANKRVSMIVDSLSRKEKKLNKRLREKKQRQQDKRLIKGDQNENV
jgi:hypothetical protein